MVHISIKYLYILLVLVLYSFIIMIILLDILGRILIYTLYTISYY